MKQTEISTHATHVNGLVSSRLHEFHESKFPFVSRIEFIRSKLSNFSAHVYGVGWRRRRWEEGPVPKRGRRRTVPGMAAADLEAAVATTGRSVTS